MEQTFFRSLFAILSDKQVVKITTTRVGDNVTLLINKDSKLITMTGTPQEVDENIVNHLTVTTTPTEQSFDVQVTDAPDSDDDDDDQDNKSTGTGKKKSAAKEKPAKKKSSATPAFLQKMEQTPELQVLTKSTDAMPKTEAVKLVWAYIKLMNLQDKKNKRMINCDENMEKVFGKKKISMFDMAKAIDKHLSPAAAEKQTEQPEEKKVDDTAKQKLHEFSEKMDLANRALEQKNYDEAIQIYEMAASIAPEGNTKPAEQIEKAKAALKKSQFDILMEAGKSEREARKYESSLANYKNALELFPDNAEAIKQVALAEKWVKALEELES